MSQPLVSQVDLGSLHKSHLLIVPSSTAVAEVVAEMHRLGVSCALVTNAKQLVGIFTERELISAIASGCSLSSTPVEACMVANLSVINTATATDPMQVLSILKQESLPYLPIADEGGSVLGVVSAQTLLESYKEALQRSESKLDDILNSAIAVITSLYLFDDYTWEYDYRSAGSEIVFGYTSQELMQDKNLWQSRVLPEDWEQIMVPALVDIRKQIQKTITVTYRFRCKNGEVRWISEAIASRRDHTRQCWVLTLVTTDITPRKQIEEALQQKAERERVMAAITHNIHQSLDLDEILTTAVADVRQLLQCDRVLIYRFNPDWSGVVAVESVISPWQTVLGEMMVDSCFAGNYVAQYQQGRISALEDICTAPIRDCYREMLLGLQVRANLVLPILMENGISPTGEGYVVHPHQASNQESAKRTPQLWGLLIAHHCVAPRQWQQTEIDLLKNVAIQLGVAIQQSELYRRLQQFNVSLEQQVEERTTQLQRSLFFEGLLTRISDRVRVSLDQQQILQTVVQELCIGLGAICCDVALYDLQQKISTIQYEYIVDERIPSLRGKTFPMQIFSQLYTQLLEGQSVQCCWLSSGEQPHQSRHHLTGAACPLVDDQGVLGDIWLFRDCEQGFDDFELRVVQQVANQCAIALRQARLYQVAQNQVEELERLNQLKDDFLSTVSHELRTPMSSIKMATEMLELHLFKQNKGLTEDTIYLQKPSIERLSRYFKILKDECQREISLINDLLDLARLEGGFQLLLETQLSVPQLISSITTAFAERTQAQQQQLKVEVAADLPPLLSDLPSLERILLELLQNACKYTPPGETITISAKLADRSDAPHIQISVCNTGTEIPPAERDRIFEKFYRIPNSDPWKHGGTGLGLALVKKLAERLSGTVELTSAHRQTTFTLTLPLKVEAVTTSRLR